MKKRIVLIALLAALASLLFATLPAAAPATVTLNPYEQQLIKLINVKRHSHGLAAVTMHENLVMASQAHAADMASRQYFGHNGAGGETWSARLIRFGYTKNGYSTWKAGEDIYWGGGLYGSPVAAVAAWMRSPSHRAVILTSKFRDIGVGAVMCKSGYGNCNSPVWFFTLDLGRRIQ